MKKKRETEPKQVDVDKLLQAAAAAVKKSFDDDDLTMEIGTEALLTPSVWVSSGSWALDRIIRGILPGGLPIGPYQGRLMHIFGLWSTAKSLLADHFAKSTQDIGGLVLVSESEGTRDGHFAKAIGLNIPRLHIQRPKSIEFMCDGFLKWHDALRAAESKAGATHRPVLWIADTLDSTEANKSADKGLSEGGGWQFGGGRSTALGAGLRKIVRRCSRYPTAGILLNQTRINVGVMFGDKTTTSGGQPPHFYASVEIALKPSKRGVVRGKYLGQKLDAALAKRRGVPVEGKGHVIGAWVHAKIKKTKVSDTYDREADFFVNFRTGISATAGLFDVLREEGVTGFLVDNRRVWHRMSDGKRKVFQNEAKWEAWILENPAVLRDAPPTKVKKLKRKVRRAA